MSTFKHANREEWLNAIAEEVTPWFEESGAPLPRYRLTTGWTGRGKSKTTMGQCWSPNASADGTTEIFISPVIDDPLEAAEVLLHELVHAAVGNEEKHGPVFRQVAVALGFMSPMKSTPASDELKDRLQQVIKIVGPYPHAALDYTKRKRDGTRLIKAVCPHCGYNIRITNIWASTGAPICPNHLTVMRLIGAPTPELPNPVEGIRKIADVFGMLVERMTENELRQLGLYVNYFNGEHAPPEILLGADTFDPEPSDTDEVTALKSRLNELRAAMQKVHPDKGGNHDEFIEIRREFEAVRRELKNAQERANKEKAA